jgi:signal transduction protein with GAF and PtsI domain
MPAIPEPIQSAATLADALEATLQHFAADSGTVHLLEADGVLHLKAASRGIPEAAVEHFRLIPIGKGMAGLAVQRAVPVTACNIQTDVTGDVRPGAKLTGLEGAIVVPMMKNGAAVGAYGIANREPRTFHIEEIELLQAIAAHLAAKHG